MPIQPGTKVGRYQIKSIIGKGGMAMVYRAFDTRLKRDVAIKFIRMDQFGPSQWPQIRKRFEREALVMAKLDHPHIIKVFDYGEFEGTPYLVMQLVEGGSLKQRIGKPIPWQQAILMMQPIVKALSYAHTRGIIHRDVKPGNILFNEDGEPVLADFGIAKIVENGSGDSLTSSGVGMGTVEYMSPEQAMGEKVDQRADIYSLGVLLYEMITGTRPFKADTPMKVVVLQTTQQLPPASTRVRNLPVSVDDLFKKALAKNPDERFANMAAFGRALATLSGSKVPEARQSAEPASPVVATRLDQPVYQRRGTTGRKPRIPVWVFGVAAAVILIVISIFLLDTNSIQYRQLSQSNNTIVNTAKPADDLPASGKTVKVCLVMEPGVDSDPYKKMFLNGLENAKRELNVLPSVFESGPDEFSDKLETCRMAGNDLIIATGPTNQETMSDAARAHPNQKYAIADSFAGVHPQNMLGNPIAVEESAFLAGYLSAGMTDSGQIGIYTGTYWEAIKPFLDGYYQGMQYYNKVHGERIQLIGYTPADPGRVLQTFDWADQDKGKMLTRQLMEQGADIILPVAGGVGLGTVAYMQQVGRGCVIGVDLDWGTAYPSTAPWVLASVVKQADVFISQAIQQVARGEFEGGRDLIGDLENRGTRLVFGNSSCANRIPSDLRMEIENLKGRIQISGLESIK